MLNGVNEDPARHRRYAGLSGRKVMTSGAPVNSATKPAAASTTTYSLSLDQSSLKVSDLEKHADHQVQLTARLQAPSAAAAKPTPGSAQTSPATTPTAGGAHNTFEVTGVKMLAARCGS